VGIYSSYTWASIHGLTYTPTKTTSYKSSLVALKGAVGASLDLVDPLTSNRSHLRWQMDKVPCTGALQGSNLL